METIQKERLVQEFLELVKIDSLTFHERKMADYIKKRLQEIGITVYEDQSGELYGGDTGNLYAVVPKTDQLCEEEPILFVAHMDTVSPGVGKKAIVHKDGKITSDGTTILGADDLSAVAILLEALTELKEEGLKHRNIELLFTIAEEAYTLGAGVFDYSKIKAKEAYVLDVSGPVGTISMQEPTLISFCIIVEGKASHAGFEASKGISAIAIAAKAISSIKQGQIDDITTLNFGIINGGEATNIVPERVTIKGEIRSIDHEKALHLYRNAVHIFNEIANEYGGKIKEQSTIHLTAYRKSKEDRVVKRYQQVCDQLSIPIQYRYSFGGSDNNVLCRNGIQGAVIANAMNLIHTKDEYTTVDELMKATQIVKELMKS